MISVIVPTHNRVSDLKRCLVRLSEQASETSFEVVVVTNNCSDNSREVAESFAGVVVVDEPNTAFSKARNSGARAARGEVLVFLDDDAELWPGSLDVLSTILDREPDLGILAGKIVPRFAATPPAWTLKCQKTHNGWSLYPPPTLKLNSQLQRVDWAAGPCMAIRTETYWETGGFPPDTLGVESNSGRGNFSKWYIGPGDYGLSTLVRATGRYIGYHPGFGVYHVIPEFRMTRQFWLSRFYGEGIYMSISDRQFWQRNARELTQIQLRRTLRLTIARGRWRWSQSRIRGKGLTPSALDAVLCLSYLAAAKICVRFPRMGSDLWEMARDGVPDSDFDVCRGAIPQEFIRLAEPDYVAAASSEDPVQYLEEHVDKALDCA